MHLFVTLVLLAAAALAFVALRKTTRPPFARGRGRRLTALRLLRDPIGALLPAATTTLQETGAGISLGTDLICVLSVTEKGVDLSSGGVIQQYSKVADVQTTFGRSEGLPFLAHYVSRTNKPFLFGALKNGTAATVTNVDVTGVTGSSVITFTGTPFDDEEIWVSCVVGGTIATAGITVKYSRDRGRTWSGNLRLGTATTLALGDTGITANFAAGTLVAGDVAKCVGVSPKWLAADLTNAFTALKARAQIPRAVVVIGDVSASAQLSAITAAILDYETSVNRFSRVFINFMDQYEPAAGQLAGQTVTTAQAGKTYTRSAGSWVTDGFQVGMTVTFGGFTNSASNGAHTIATVTATVLTVVEAIGANETTVANTTATATETDSAWQTRIEALVGATPSTQVISHKTASFAGRARKQDLLNGFFKRRPAMWAAIIRWMSVDVKTSPGRVADGGLQGWTITDLNGNTEDHDERVSQGLLAMRVGCLRTYAEVGVSGVYVANALTLDNDNAMMSRVQVGGVADIAANIVQSAMVQFLLSGVELNKDGTITEAEAKRCESKVTSILKQNLLVPSLGGNDPGARASSVTFRLDRTPNLAVPGTQVPTETDIIPLGYVEQITNRVVVVNPASA